MKFGGGGKELQACCQVESWISQAPPSDTRISCSIHSCHLLGQCTFLPSRVRTRLSADKAAWAPLWPAAPSHGPATGSLQATPPSVGTGDGCSGQWAAISGVLSPHLGPVHMLRWLCLRPPSASSTSLKTQALIKTARTQ